MTMLLCPFLRHVPHCGLITCRLLPLPNQAPKNPMSTILLLLLVLVQAEFLGVLSDYCSRKLKVNHFTSAAGMVPGPSKFFEKKGVLSDYCSPNLEVNHFTTGAGMVPGPREVLRRDFQ